MTVGELIEHSDALMNKAIADAYERRLVLERFGRKPGKFAPRQERTIGLTSGYRKFGDPLYQGWAAPSEIANFVDVLHAPPGRALRAVGPVAAAVKNTVFGVADIGVFGVQVAKLISVGGPTLLARNVNRSLELLSLPHLNLYDAVNLPHTVQAAMAGVHQGIGPASITLKGGTVVKYIPVIGETLDRPLTKAVDALARVQFGGILTPLRNQLYEGSLLTLHATGQDITNPAVRRIAANWANAMTGASRGAMQPGRRALETVGLTSFQMMRSEMATLGQIAKAAFSPQASRAERIIGMMTLANFGAMVYGVGSAVNMAFGEGPVEFDPRKSDWASLHVGGQVVPMMPQRGLTRAIGKSIDALMNEDPVELATIWTQYTTSKLNPAWGGGPAAAGFGFEPGVGFRMGDMTATGRLLNMVPMPPLVEQYATSFITGESGQRSPFAMGAGAFGFNTWQESPYRQLNKASQVKFGKDVDELGPDERRQLEAENAGLIKQMDRQRELRAAVGDPGAEYGVRLQHVSEDYNGQLAEAVKTKSGPDLREEYNRIQADRRAAQHTVETDPRFAGVVGEYQKNDAKVLADAEAARAAGKPLTDKQLVATYGAIFDRHEDDATPDAMFDELDRFWAGLPNGDADRLQKNLGLSLPPEIQTMRKELGTLRNYWAQDQRAWADAQQAVPELRQYNSIEEAEQAEMQERAQAGQYVKPEETYWGRFFARMLQNYRLQYIYKNSSVDPILVKWYGRSPRTEAGMLAEQEEVAAMAAQ
jgi:hypothetical protein